MAIETSYTSLRARLAGMLDEVVSSREVVIVRRKDRGDVALVSADELSSLVETAHLLRSPRNAQRLLAALRRAEKRRVKPGSLDKLRREMGLAKDR